ncbi:MAG: peptidylprolyl isomerase [Ignavibacteria bacterium]
MLKKIIIFSFLYTSVFAQYTSRDYELARTTFERTFDKKIMLRYLKSEYPDSVRAALLSLGNSKDTSYIDDIISPDFRRYGNYISFALGETGPSAKSVSYLLSMIFPCAKKEYQRPAFEAVGRTADKNVLEDLIIRYMTDKNQNYDGISVAILNFALRNIKSSDSGDVKTLRREFTEAGNSMQRRTDAAFALSRSNISRAMRNDFLKTVYDKNNSEDWIILKQYSLACLRRLKAAPDNIDQIKALISLSDWRLRAEAAKVLIYYKFRTTDDLRLLFALVRDKNTNVSRQMAVSLKDAIIESGLKFYVKDELKKSIADSSLSENTRGELFFSLTKMFPDEFADFFPAYKDKVNPSFICRALAENVNDPQKNLQYLMNNISSVTKPDKPELINALLSLQRYMPDNTQLRDLLIAGLSDNIAAVVSITAEGLDSAFIASNKEEIKKIISRQINLYLNNPDYSECLISLINSGRRISGGFSLDMIKLLRTSTVYSLQVYACRELGRNCRLQKQLNNFYTLWNMAFKYRSAKIYTTKGNFTIQFTPGITPISTGNFCRLASDGFFDKITFHRVVPGFIIQSGDPSGTGYGGPGYDIISEYSPAGFDKGSVGMSGTGRDTEGSQWFIVHSNYPHLNGQYSNFAKVTEGMDIINMIDQGDSISGIELIK